MSTAGSTALLSLRAAGEAIYPSTEALLDRFAPLAMTRRAQRTTTEFVVCEER